MKYFKSIFIAFVLVFGFALTNNVAQAGWNENNPGTDCISVGIMITNQNGTQSGCNQYTTSANAGVNDLVNVQVYFRNTTANQTAQNTVGSITHVRNSATSYSFTGSLTSSLGGISPRTVNLTIPGSTRLVFTGAKVYQRNGPGTSPVVTQQVTSTSALQNVSIGSVPGYTSCATGANSDAFCYQGVLVASYRVERDSTVQTYACNDGIDNDGDGYTDYPSDVGCYSSTDSDEYNTTTQACVINSFYASPTTVTSGSSTMLYWSTTGCTTVTIDGVQYPTNSSGYFGPLYSGRTYNLAANNGIQYPTQNVYVGVSQINNPTYVCNDGIDNDNDGYRDYPNDPGCSSYTDNDEYNYLAQEPLVTTISPTNLTSNSGTMNGTAFNQAGGSSEAYFEWGTNPSNLANISSPSFFTVSTQFNFSSVLNNAQPGTTYYYRAVLKTNNGRIYRGDVKEFRIAGVANPPVVTTPTTTIVTTPIIRTVTTATAAPTQGVVGLGTNLVQLRYINDQFASNNNSFGVVNTINNGAQNVCVDDIAKFVVEYKNISNIVLTNAILHIDIPKDVEFRSTGAGVYNKADNTITINVGTLNPEQSGVISFDGVVLDSAANRDLLVVPATLSFENPNNGARETAVAYGLATTQNCVRNNNLAGFAFGSGFFPNTLIGWLILILVLLTLVYIIRRWLSLPPVLRATDKRRMVERHYEDLDVPTAPYRH